MHHDQIVLLFKAKTTCLRYAGFGGAQRFPLSSMDLYAFVISGLLFIDHHLSTIYYKVR
jgi:hypothetical protein